MASLPVSWRKPGVFPEEFPEAAGLKDHFVGCGDSTGVSSIGLARDA